MELPYYPQEAEHTCGPASGRMILASLGVRRREHDIAMVLGTKRNGTNDEDFIKLAHKYRLHYISKKNATFDGLKKLQKKGYKIIVSYWYTPDKTGHYAVLRKVGRKYVHLFDPWAGPKHKYSISYFRKLWDWSLCDEPDTNRRWFFAVKA
ncbi:C39 family peptidase [Candidatus Woesearchaeota archaeon]|nr:C39 family peptidase [Candidatus Woesearchaeota archaeon]